MVPAAYQWMKDVREIAASQYRSYVINYMLIHIKTKYHLSPIGIYDIK